MTEKEKEFINLIETNQGIIYKVARSYSKSEHEFNDLWQEILMRLWKSYENFRGESKFSTWMYRISINTAVSIYRKEKKHYKEYNNNIIPDISEDIIYEVERNEKISILYKAIEKLNDIEKAIIMLYMEGCSYDDMSEILGISISNIGVKINRTKNKLKKIINKLGYEF